jgi:ribosome biogenesis GTPase
VSLEDIGWTPAVAFYFQELGDDSLIPARVSRVDRGRAKVMSEAEEQSATWLPTLEFTHGEAVGTPAIGDWCACSRAGDLLRIEAVFPRGGSVVRGVSSGDRATQVLAANVDVAFIVTGLDGDFSVRRIERYLALARAGGVRPVVVLNKVDVCDAIEERFQEAKSVASGVTVVHLCALDTASSDAVRREIGPRQTAVFLGSSGVGKSTLVNQLLGEQRQATASVRAKDDTGRHTTTRRELIPLVGGGVVIDTPGIREVGVLADPDSLGSVFEEIAELAGGEGGRLRR